MTELLESVVLVAGASYLFYRIYSFWIMPILGFRRGRSKPDETHSERTEPWHGFQDVA
jgi:hypothetical protein